MSDSDGSSILPPPKRQKVLFFLNSESSSLSCSGILWRQHIGRHKSFYFQENTGIPVNESASLEEENELRFYKKFIDDQIIFLFVSETNRYVEQTIIEGITSEAIEPNSRLNQWNETDGCEMWTYLGFRIWMGLDRKPRETLLVIVIVGSQHRNANKFENVQALLDVKMVQV